MVVVRERMRKFKKPQILFVVEGYEDMEVNCTIHSIFGSL